MSDRRQRWTPPTTDRAPIYIHPEAVTGLRDYLVHEQAGTGIGYSEFIMQSIELWRAADRRERERRSGLRGLLDHLGLRRTGSHEARHPTGGFE